MERVELGFTAALVAVADKRPMKRQVEKGNLRKDEKVCLTGGSLKPTGFLCFCFACFLYKLLSLSMQSQCIIGATCVLRPGTYVHMGA